MKPPVFGSTGDPPVPSGDSPDGMGATVPANGDGLFSRLLSAFPVGGSPTGAGESPALPIFKTRSEVRNQSQSKIKIQSKKSHWKWDFINLGKVVSCQY